MKLVLRLFALLVVVAGAMASLASSNRSQFIATHISTGMMVPIPTCGPGIPGCPANPGQ